MVANVEYFIYTRSKDNFSFVCIESIAVHKEINHLARNEISVMLSLRN